MLKQVCCAVFRVLGVCVRSAADGRIASESTRLQANLTQVHTRDGGRLERHGCAKRAETPGTHVRARAVRACVSHQSCCVLVALRAPVWLHRSWYPLRAVSRVLGFLCTDRDGWSQRVGRHTPPNPKGCPAAAAAPHTLPSPPFVPYKRSPGTFSLSLLHAVNCTSSHCVTLRVCVSIAPETVWPLRHEHSLDGRYTAGPPKRVRALCVCSSDT